VVVHQEPDRQHHENQQQVHALSTRAAVVCFRALIFGASNAFQLATMRTRSRAC
jgi:hypothetical protein